MTWAEFIFAKVAPAITGTLGVVIAVGCLLFAFWMAQYDDKGGSE